MKTSWLLLVLFSGLVGCVAPDLWLYGIVSNIGDCTTNANGCSLLSTISVINVYPILCHHA